VNKVETGVRARHLPTGLTATFQSRMQGKNREDALRLLAAKVAERKRSEQLGDEVSTRRAQLGSGDRSQKMRTYDFPEGLVVDHRFGIKVHRLQDVLRGDLELLRPPD
jgi:peptide chain release factor 1